MPEDIHNVKRVVDLVDAIAAILTDRGARVAIEDKQGRCYSIKRVYTVSGGKTVIISAKGDA